MKAPASPQQLTRTSKEEPEMSTEPKIENGSGVCRCGTCGELVGGKSLYRPGHDARHASIIGHALAETGDDSLLEQLPSDNLQAKAIKIAEAKVAKEEAREAREAAKAEARKEREHAKDAAKVHNKKPAWSETEAVKVGRWTYPARTNGKVIQRNTKRDGSGEWVAA